MPRVYGVPDQLDITLALDSVEKVGSSVGVMLFG